MIDIILKYEAIHNNYECYKIMKFYIILKKKKKKNFFFFFFLIKFSLNLNGGLILIN